MNTAILRKSFSTVRGAWCPYRGWLCEYQDWRRMPQILKPNFTPYEGYAN